MGFEDVEVSLDGARTELDQKQTPPEAWGGPTSPARLQGKYLCCRWTLSPAREPGTRSVTWAKGRNLRSPGERVRPGPRSGVETRFGMGRLCLLVSDLCLHFLA